MIKSKKSKADDIFASTSISHESFHALSAEFIEWLQQPAQNAFESVVKLKRQLLEKDIKPYRNNVRFLFGLLIQKGVLREGTSRLGDLADIDICKNILSLLDHDRNVGIERQYQLLLLIKKILVFLSSTQSNRTNRVVPPDSIPSYV